MFYHPRSEAATVTVTARHIDAHQLRAPEETDEGYLKLEGVVATPGILPYFRDGKVIREFVPAKTLQDPKFLESLEGKPITLEHPDGERLGPNNDRRLSIGTVFNVRWCDDIDDWHREDSGVVAELIIRDPRGIEAFRGEGSYAGQPKRQLSPAYDVELKKQDGVNEYGRYDAVQIDRRAGNHVALTASGRDGQQSAVRVDSFVNAQLLVAAPWAVADDIFHEDSSDESNSTTQQGDEPMSTVKFHLDGMGIVDLPEETVEVIKEWRADQIENLEEMKQQIQAVKEERDRLQAQLEELQQAAGTAAEVGGTAVEEEGAEMADGEMGDGEYADGPGQGEAARDEYMDGGRTDSDDETPDRYDNFDAWYEDLRGVEKTAEKLRLDSDDLPNNPTDAKRAVLNQWRDDDEFADGMDPDRVDAKYEIVADLIDEQAEQRADSERAINNRASERRPRRDGTSGGESTGRDAYVEKVYG